MGAMSQYSAHLSIVLGRKIEKRIE